MEVQTISAVCTRGLFKRTVHLNVSTLLAKTKAAGINSSGLRQFSASHTGQIFATVSDANDLLFKFHLLKSVFRSQCSLMSVAVSFCNTAQVGDISTLGLQTQNLLY